MSDKIKGSCQCKAVQYEINPTVKLVGNCHCTICRKITGASFSTIVIVAEDDFTVVQGTDQLSTWQVSGLAAKNFCCKCGTPIFNTNKKYPGRRMIFLGSFDDPKFATPTVNVHCENKLPWVDSIEELKSFDQDMS
jgi:hypothetical protein